MTTITLDDYKIIVDETQPTVVAAFQRLLDEVAIPPKCETSWSLFKGPTDKPVNSKVFVQFLKAKLISYFLNSKAIK